MEAHAIHSIDDGRHAVGDFCTNIKGKGRPQDYRYSTAQACSILDDMCTNTWRGNHAILAQPLQHILQIFVAILLVCIIVCS